MQALRPGATVSLTASGRAKNEVIVRRTSVGVGTTFEIRLPLRPPGH